MSIESLMKDNSILKLVILEKPTEIVRTVVAVTQGECLHPARAPSE